MSNTIYKCNTCAKEFKSQRSLNSHLNWHKPGYAEKSKAGAQLGAQTQIKTRIKNNTERRHTYYLNPNKCLECYSPIDFSSRNNKFCSRSCSGTHTNKSRTAQSFIDQGITLKNKNKSKTTSQKLQTNTRSKGYGPFAKTCTQCNNLHINNGKTCSIKCKHSLISTKVSAAISSGKHAGNRNRGRTKRSYMEISFEKWLNDNGFIDKIDYETEYHIKRVDDNGKFIKNYFVDFYFANINVGIELDGTQHKHTIEADKSRDDYISTLGVTIYRITHKEYLEKTKLEFVMNLLGIKIGT